jgi:hypothetical protein
MSEKGDANLQLGFAILYGRRPENFPPFVRATVDKSAGQATQERATGKVLNKRRGLLKSNHETFSDH